MHRISLALGEIDLLSSIGGNPFPIAPHNPWPLWALILAGVAISIYLEQTYRWAARISGPVLCLIFAMAMTNLKIMPTKAPAYDLVEDYLVPIAIPLLLFRADVLNIVRTSGPTFAAFHVSTLGTMLGALLAGVLFHGRFDRVPEVAGIMAASYIGGSINFFAAKGSFDVSENLTNPLLVADNIIMAGMFIALLAIASTRWFLARYPHPHCLNAHADDGLSTATYWRRKEVSLLDIATALALAVAIAALSCKLSVALKTMVETAANPGASIAENRFSFIAPLVKDILANRFVLITLFSVLTATLLRGRLEKIRGTEELGAYLLYIFFFVIGLPADLVAVVTNVPLMFVFCLVIAVVNLAVTLGLGRLLGMNLEDLLIAVNANLGGPPTAAAMAVSKGWSRLVLPALLVGIWGYVIGTFLGLFIGNLLLQFQ